MIASLADQPRIWHWRANLCADKNKTRNIADGAKAKAESRPEALLGTGLLAKGQDGIQAAQTPAAEQGALTPVAELPIERCKEGPTNPAASLTRRR